MKKLVRHIFAGLKWVVICIAALVALVLVAIYLPPTQRLIIDKVLSTINAGGTLSISADELRLRFPLTVEARNLNIATASKLDISTARADVEVDFLPLLRGSIHASHISFDSTYVGIGTPDSMLYMQARLASADIRSADLRLGPSKVDIDKVTLAGGRINLAIKPDTTKTAKTSEPVKWKIKIDDISLADIDYSMTMLPTIDSLAVHLGKGEIAKGKIDLEHSVIDIAKVGIDSVDALYLTPPVGETAAAQPVEAPADTVPSEPISVFVKQLALTNSHAIYAASGAVPTQGFDPQYIEVRDIDIRIDSLFNRGTQLRVPLRRLAGAERCGLLLSASGLFEMDSVLMRADNFAINTAASAFTLSAKMGIGDLAADPTLPLSVMLHGYLAPSDIQLIMPTTAPVVKSLPARNPLRLDVDVEGTSGRLEIERVAVSLPDHADIAMSGSVADPFDFDSMDGRLDITGHIINADFIKPTLLDAKTVKEINIPRLTLRGEATARHGTLGGSLKALTGGGSLALDATWNGGRETYQASVDASQFPVQSILTTLGLRDLTASIDVKGQGYDPFSAKTAITAHADVESALLGRTSLKNITLDANLAHGVGDIALRSANPAADVLVSARGNLSGDTLRWALEGDVRNVDLYALGMSDTTARAATRFSGTAQMSPRGKSLDVDLDIETLRWLAPDIDLNASDIRMSLAATDSSTVATINNHDLEARFESPNAIDSIAARMGMVSDLANKGIHDRQLDIDSIHKVMPKFSFDLTAGPANVLQSYLNQNGNRFRSLTLSASNKESIRLDAKALDVVTGSTRLDTLKLSVLQFGDALIFKGNLDNAPGTLDQFAHVLARGYVAKTRAGVHVEQADIKGKTGYKLGLSMYMPDSNLVRLSFTPLNPIIGYKNWTVNDDNYLDLDLKNKHFDADLEMKSTESSIRIFTEHVPGDSTQEDVVLQLSDIKLADWIEINPFAPPIKGDLSADMRFKWGGGAIDGKGTVGLADFYYGRQRVGTFDLDVDLYTNREGVMRAQTALMVDGVKTITAVGNLNDSTAQNPFLLDLQMIRFPLAVVNPFLPPQTAKLSGVLNGSLDVTGDAIHPIFNGDLHFDTTAIKIDILGSTFRFSDNPISVKDNLVRFEKYAISTLNANPLIIDGTVDIDRLASPEINLHLSADNSQIVNSNRPRGASVYGKAFIGLNADVKGNLDQLDVDAALSLLPGTNVTYVMTDAEQTLTSRSNGDMVRFVNFADTTAMEVADTVARSGMSLDLTAKLNISSGTTVNVDLSADGKNKVQIESNGTLTYSMNALNDDQMFGRLDITGGFVRYTPPLMSEKNFKFKEGSYVTFTGNMLNPNINLQAVDQMKATVNEDGQNSRLVDFDVALNVTGTLETLNVSFDLSTPDDLSVENELQSMSPEQRANQAMNLLLYNMYTGPGTTASAGGSVNLQGRLYSFLASTLNSWAANNIKGVELTFGVNQYDQTVDGNTSTATSYSYRVSKSLFDDRFKIVVGGNYDTNPDADENFAENLINDISFEYLLNKNGSMVLKLFRHTGFESILEGEVTQTGVGFVYKRKIRRIADIFRFSHRRQSAPSLTQEGKPINN